MKTSDLVDRIGLIKANLAPQLEALKALEAELKAKGAGSYEGSLFDANVSESVRETLDMKAVREKLLAIDHAGWCDVVLRDLEGAHPRIRDHVERIDVLRWGHAMVRPIPGVRTAAARGDGQRPFRSVHFAHTELSAVALFEEAFWHGTRAAEEVIEALGRPLVSELGR